MPPPRPWMRICPEFWSGSQGVNQRMGRNCCRYEELGLLGADLGNTFMTLFQGKQLLCKGLIALTISSRHIRVSGRHAELVPHRSDGYGSADQFRSSFAKAIVTTRFCSYRKIADYAFYDEFGGSSCVLIVPVKEVFSISDEAKPTESVYPFKQVQYFWLSLVNCRRHGRVHSI